MYSRSLRTVMAAALAGSLGAISKTRLTTIRREELSFRVEPEEFATLARQTELVMKARSATVRLDKRRMERLRALVSQMTVPDRGSR
jgi:GGDEF domain-containing protein